MSYTDEALKLDQAHAGTAKFGAGDASTGTVIPGLLKVSCSGGRKQKTSQAQLTCQAYPDGLTYGHEVQYFHSINGQAALLYRGDFIDAERADDGSGQVVLKLQGIRASLNDPWGGAPRRYGRTVPLTDAECYDGAVIRNLIEAKGWPSSRHRILDSVLVQADGSDGVWLIGRFKQVVVKNGDPLSRLIDDLDEAQNYLTYDQLVGFIDRTRSDPAATTSDFARTFAVAEGSARSITLRTSPRQIVNRWEVTGLTVFNVPKKYVASATSAILDARSPGTAPNTVGQTFQSDLVETANHVQRCAERKLLDTNREDKTLEIVFPTVRADIWLADTLVTGYSTIDVPAGTAVLSDAIQHEVDWTAMTFQTTVTTNGGTLL